MNIVSPETAPMVEPLIKALVSELLSPAIAALTRKMKNKNSMQRWPLRFERYLFESYKRHSYLNTLVLSNSQILLSDLYVPLALSYMRGGKVRKRILIDRFPDALLKCKNSLIIDSVGMGKSTIMKKIFLTAIEERKCVPIFIELRRLTDASTLVDLIAEELSTLTEPVDKTELMDLLETGNFLFLLDGYDEIPFDQRTRVTSDLQQFVGKAGNNFFVISSRPESALLSFGNFLNHSVEPLKIDQAYSLIRKFASFRDPTLGKNLISQLKKRHDPSIREFLKSPLLVSLLFKSYLYKPIIPNHKHIFYENVFRALYEEHDFTKGGSYSRPKRSGLSIDEFERVLHYMGFHSVVKNTIEYDRNGLLLLIRDSAEKLPGIVFQDTLLLDDLTHAVPLFKEEGLKFRWSHKSLAEYFAAFYIRRDAPRPAELLSRMFNSDQIQTYANTIDLSFDIDYGLFRRAILFPVCVAFVTHMEAFPIRSSGTNRSRRSLRRALTFAGETFVAVVKNPEINAKLAFDDQVLQIGSRIDSNIGQVIKTSLGNIVLAGVSSKSISALYEVLQSRSHPLLVKSPFRDGLNSHHNEITLLTEFATEISKVPAVRVDYLAGSPVNDTRYYDLVNDLLLGIFFGTYFSLEEAKKIILEVEKEDKRLREATDLEAIL